MMRLSSLLVIFSLVCVLVISQKASDDQAYQVLVPSRQELEVAFQAKGLSDFVQKTGIIDRVNGRIFSDVNLLSVGINAQLAYDKAAGEEAELAMFQESNQRKLYAILFQNNLAAFERFKQAGMI